MKTLILPFILLFLILSSQNSQAQGPRYALQLDGYDDHVFFDYNNRGITNQVTVEAWVKTTATKLQLITAKYNRDQEHGYQLVMRDGKAAFSGRDGSGEYRISGYSPRIINDNQWHHLAGVSKDGTWAIYIDGVLESQSVTGYTNVDLRSNAPFTVGNYYLVNNDFFQGQLDELKIWKKGLSEAEIRNGMCQTVDKANPDLVAYLKFDEGSGSTLTDHSSYGINGTFRNMNTATAWVVSGAPIGDKSVYLYPTVWSGQQLIINSTSGNKLSITSSSSGLKGMHIYTVSSQPNTLSGIENIAQVSDYIGVFKVGNSNSTYTATGEQANPGCFRTLYQRAGNTASSWGKASETVTPAFPSFTSGIPISEFILNTSTTGTASILGKSTFCTGASTTLSVNSNGDVLWSTGETSKSIQVITAGIYSVTINENGCTSTDNITVTEVNPPIVELGPDQTICQGTVVQLQATTGPYTYKWSNGSTASAINISQSGNYWVQVTNASGCTNTDNINIAVEPKPAIGLATSYLLCPGEKITLDATVSGATYNWSTGAITPTITASLQGTYWVEVTINGCTFSYNTTVNHKAVPAFLIHGPTQFCESNTITLSVPAAGTIQWSTGATTQSITVTKGGKYTVQTLIDGCTLTDEITITEVPLPTFSLGDDLSICKGEKVILTAPGDMKAYRWNTGATSSTIEVESAGTYWVEITNTSGCVFRDEITITLKQEPVIELPATINACYGEVITLNATTPDAAYVWSNGQTSASINVTAPAEVSVKITVDGCEYIHQVNILSDECPIIPNIITPNNDGKNDTFVVGGLNIDNIDIEIFNRWGKSIYKRSGYDNTWTTGATGIYFYHIKSRITKKDYKGWLEVVK